MKTIYLVSILFSLAFQCFSSPVKIEDEFYFVDSNSTHTAHTIDWSKAIAVPKTKAIEYGFSINEAIWIRLTISNEDSSYVQTHLCIPNIYIDSITFFMDTSMVTMGDRTIYRSPFLTSIALPLNLKANEKKEIIIRAKKSLSFFDFNYDLQSQENLQHATNNRTLFVSFFIGLISLLIILNTILLLLTHKKLYGLYITYSIITAWYILITTGLAQFYFFKTFLFFSELRIYFGVFGSIIQIWFISNYLELRKEQSKAYFILNTCNWAAITSIVISFFLLYFKQVHFIKPLTIATYFFYLINAVVIFIAAIKKLKTDKSKGAYVILAFLPLLLWGSIYVLKSYSWTHFTVPTDWLTIACLFEVLLFGYVMAQNYLAAFKSEKRLQKTIVAQQIEALQQISQIQIKERMDIAHLLHDKFNGDLTTTLLFLEDHETFKATSLLQNVSKELRSLSHQIMPKSLEMGDIIAALTDQINLLESSKLHLNINSFSFPNFIPIEIAQPIYLCTLELIQNAIKHGKCSTISIELYGYENLLSISVIDNGIGFESVNTSHGFGLRSIKSRLLAMKGTLDIMSQPNEGTHATINVSINT